jgi:uncharacterized protein YbjT (DUF2867 family)
MEMNVLVTGGTGELGRIVVRNLAGAGHTVRSASRRAPHGSLPHGATWTRLDLEIGAGLAEALDGVQTIVHAASNPAGKLRRTDVDGTRRLLERARAGGVQHVVYISIVGIDRVPQFFY